MIRKDSVACECWSFCRTCLQTVFSSTVLGEEASEVGQPRGAGSNLHGCHPPNWTAVGEEEDDNLNARSCLVSLGFCS